MFEKSCRCGKTKKNFKVDIGEFFVNTCCEESGFDHLGRSREINPEDLGLNSQELQSSLEGSTELEIIDEGETPELEVQPEPEKKKKRSYHRGGNLRK